MKLDNIKLPPSIECSECPICLALDCECEDILSPEEYDRLIKEETE